MTENEVLEILKHISDSDEKCANDVIYALTLLETNVENMLESIKNQMVDDLAENKFNNINKLNSFCGNITNLHNQVYTCISALK